MSALYETEKVLMVVKTYPTPSAAYGETICTGGIRLKDNTWVRIFPFPFRLADVSHRFKKWEVIELPLSAPNNDPRPESRRLYDVTQIRSVEELDTDKGYWTRRMEYLLPTVAGSVQEVLSGIPEKGNQHWGNTIKPVRIKPGTGIVIVEQLKDENWTAEEITKLANAENMAKNGIFSHNPDTNFRQLRKFPYKFRLQFEDLTGSQYTFPITDWELPSLYFRLTGMGEPRRVVIEKIVEYIQNVILDPEKHSYAILGTAYFQYKQKNLVIGGFVYHKPPKPKPASQMRGLWETDE